ncbi:hypothetical protein JTE90_028314 [Oedothorax gibbosus]|uniref:Uncharacterized protein n=1 Tax=Oedothorax gibbosus TaxID=931172 RepID=A0AAV6V2J7_9ARAC|nr:hypothetical protein JTE90_028314 [Oedothorax gibbosus]
MFRKSQKARFVKNDFMDFLDTVKRVYLPHTCDVPGYREKKDESSSSRAAPTTNRVETAERSGGEGAAVPCREERRSGERGM